MRVSIVITNHNYGRFVGHAIESALAQTHRDAEVLVVDDGSTDDSLATIERYEQITLLRRANHGQAASFNAALARATGEAAIFLDADDVLAPDTASAVADVFERRPRVVKVMYRLRVVDEEGAATGEIKPPSHLPLRSGDLRRYVLRFPFDMTWMATSGNAFRVSALRTILPIPEEDYPRVGADWYLSHVVPLLGDVEFLERIGGAYRVHGANSYERAAGVVDLDQVRQTIEYSRHTARHIARVAAELELRQKPRAEDLRSVADIWQRLLSLRLDPARHPVAGDTRGALLVDGVRAAAGRFDVSLALRLVLGAWVAAVALAPKATLPLLIRALALRERGGLTRVFQRLHRRPAPPEAR